eukprot:CAMPEP_0114554166 /NCGR_PEP_ID=MMETSP0114-20121206/8063_1 /TAXON_ID=31324 /ORGANISM="Goniomonas sp, Strain m" /LENGTH=398 /DNA_ID=CAMNT_0001739191 /DNA_START=42 /DNA_END=1238 /DNA_ORIENTATION=+
MVAGVFAFLQAFVVPALVQSKLAGFQPGTPVEVSAAAQKVHQDLLVVDLHADSLFVNRDLLKRADMGCTWYYCSRSHVDVPRMLEGNLALQVFTVFAQIPVTFSFESNSNSTLHDVLNFVVPLSGWPLNSWFSLKQRALYQARKLADFSARSEGRLRIIKTKQDLEQYISDRSACSGKSGGCDFTAGLLGIEGAHALDGEVVNMNEMFDSGFRLVGLQHFFDNDFGGSMHGESKHGLTEKGKALVLRMEKLGIAVDLAHSSEAVMDDVLDIVTKPLFVSHSGARATCNNNRTLTDHHIRRVCGLGGVIGAGFWDGAVCGNTVKDIVVTMKHIIKVGGIECVGLGSDWDGAVKVPAGLDAAGLSQITQALLELDIPKHYIAAIMGGNALRVFAATLPSA